MAKLYSDLVWQEKDIPRCFTPVNEPSFIKSRRLVILIWVTNEVSAQEVTGQVNLKLQNLTEVRLSNKKLLQATFLNQPVVLANNTVALMDGEMSFEILDGMESTQ